MILRAKMKDEEAMNYVRKELGNIPQDVFTTTLSGLDVVFQCDSPDGDLLESFISIVIGWFHDNDVVTFEIVK